MKQVSIHKQLEIFTQVIQSGNILKQDSKPFFELNYFIEGSGARSIGGIVINYNKGDIFLLPPNQKQSFTSHEDTKSISIRFNETFLRSYLPANENLERLERNLSNVNHKPNTLFQDSEELVLAQSLLNKLNKEASRQDLFKNELIIQLLNSLLLLIASHVARSLPEKITANSCSETRTLGILQHIHENIQKPDLLRANLIADKFGVSVSYIGRYFKKHTNGTLQRYIINSRIEHVETRLLYSDLRIGEIAMELGFSDESHLIKTFKKYKGISPREFRENAKW